MRADASVMAASTTSTMCSSVPKRSRWWAGWKASSIHIAPDAAASSMHSDTSRVRSASLRSTSQAAMYVDAKAVKLPKPRISGTGDAVAVGQLGQGGRPHAALEVQVEVGLGQGQQVAHQMTRRVWPGA